MRIGYILDENFIVPAAVSIYSLLYNNRHMKDIRLFILDDGIAAASKYKLRKMVESFDRELVFIDASPVGVKIAKLTDNHWNGSYSTYSRLFLNTLLPDCDEKVIFIDADTIVHGKLDGIEDIDLEEKLFAAVLEAMPYEYHLHSRLKNRELINSGFMVIDLKKWREAKAEQKILYFLKEVCDRNMLTEEDVLSKVFYGKVKILSPEFNYLTQYYLYASDFYYRFFGWDKLNKRGVFYSLDEIDKAKQKAVVYHCIDTYTNRPWFSNNIHPYVKLFDRYYYRTPWGNERKTFGKLKLSNSLELVVRRILPHNSSRLFYAVAVKLYYGPKARHYYHKR